MVSQFDRRCDDNAVLRLTDQYNIEARAYADHWAPIVHPLACRLLEVLPRRPVERVLDLGAGAGLLLPVLQEKFRGALVVGVDRSEKLIEMAHGSAAKASPEGEGAQVFSETCCVVGDAANVCLRADTFDLVVMAFMLYHVPDPNVALKETMRVLKRRGVLGLTTWAGDMESPVVTIWNEELEASGAVPAESLGRVARHELMDTPEKVQGLLESAGFDSIRANIQEFAHEIEPDEFIRLRVTVGSTRQRFETLDGKSRQRLIGRVRERFSGLTADDWVLRLPVVLATARALN